jgi:hypothetical protein
MGCSWDLDQASTRLNRLRDADQIYWSRAGLDDLHDACKKRSAKTGANPMDWTEPGKTWHLVPDRLDIPPAQLSKAANVNVTSLLEAWIDAIPPFRGKTGRPRQRPEKLQAEKLSLSQEPARAAPARHQESHRASR